MKLTNTQVLKIQQAIQQIEPSLKSITSKVRWNLTKNATIIEREAAALEKHRQKILVNHAGGRDFIDAKADPEAAAAFSKEYNEVLECENDIQGLLQVPLAELNLDVNPIPVHQLVILTPLIQE